MLSWLPFMEFGNMEIASTAAMALAMQQSLGQEASLAMIKQAAQQDAAVLQMVTAATQAQPAPGNGRNLDVSV